MKMFSIILASFLLTSCVPASQYRRDVSLAFLAGQTTSLKKLITLYEDKSSPEAIRLELINDYVDSLMLKTQILISDDGGNKIERNRR
jgi:hypothetical protein